MNRNGTSLSRIIVGALLTALPAATALASEPEASVTARGSAPATAQVTSSPAPDVITPEGAEMMAQRYRNQAITTADVKPGLSAPLVNEPHHVTTEDAA